MLSRVPDASPVGGNRLLRHRRSALRGAIHTICGRIERWLSSKREDLIVVALVIGLVVLMVFVAPYCC